ncbi:MAG: hypothetical protein U9Q99_00200 [Nanoarchaeota archaeon]|nr:hypothetical protein [Nanoarchaeota archaeon]
MVSYLTKNNFPRIKKDFLEKEIYQKLERYLEKGDFQKDFRGHYWEGGNKSTSNIISISGDLGDKFYNNFELKIIDDEDLIREGLDMDKLKLHYKNLLDIIFESK